MAEMCHIQTLRHAHTIQTHPAVTDVHQFTIGDCSVVLAHVISSSNYPASALSTLFLVGSATCFAEGCLHTLSECIARLVDCPTRNAHWQRASTMHSAMPALLMRVRHLLTSIRFPSKVVKSHDFFPLFIQHVNGAHSSTASNRLPRRGSGKLHAPIIQIHLEQPPGSSAYRNYCNEVAGDLQSTSATALQMIIVGSQEGRW